MPNTRQMNDDVLSKKLEELATKKDIESLTNLVNSLHDHIDLQNCYRDCFSAGKSRQAGNQDFPA